MDLIADRLMGKELREIQHKPGYNTIIAFEDGAITAWTEVRIDIGFGDDPIRVKELVWSDEWCEILLDAGTIRISRIPHSPNPECFIYGSTINPDLMIVDRGEEQVRVRLLPAASPQLRTFQGRQANCNLQTSSAIMSIADKEQAFLDKCDCKFPYCDAAKAEALIFEACSISSNAAFCVLYELVCPPASAQLSGPKQRDLLASWTRRTSFPLAAPIGDFAKRVLNGEAVSLEMGLALMREVAAAEGQYAAFEVVSHLAYQVAEEAEYGLIDTLEEETRARWIKA